MSTVLAIDTSTSQTSVAVVRDGEVVFTKSHNDPLAHGEYLPKLVAQALQGAPIIKDQTVAAVLLNSGCANACTGPDGFADTHRSAEKVAEVLGISASDVGICSTGLIGMRLPMDALMSGVEKAHQNLKKDSLIEVATGTIS